ncbi:hypothetical protein HanIR_Chr15g0758581 [Helianthus annuus]|nr:hypothetical protein HanIR_Chr15g0758581 [Helianthus annuus]
MVGNSITLPLPQMDGHPSPIGPTSLLFYTHFKVTLSPCNSVSLPLVHAFMAWNSITLPLLQMGGRPSPIGPTSLLFYTHFKITLSPCNNISLPLVQIGGEQYPLDQPVYYFISTLKLRFCPQLKNTVLSQLQNTFTLLPRAKKYDFALGNSNVIHIHIFSTYTNHMAGNSITLPLLQMGGRPSPIVPTNLLFYTHFKITFSPCNSVSLPLVHGRE